MNWRKFFPLTPKPRDIVLRPDPELRERRFRQFDSKRRSRAVAAVACIGDQALAKRTDAARRERVAAIKAGGHV